MGGVGVVQMRAPPAALAGSRSGQRGLASAPKALDHWVSFRSDENHGFDLAHPGVAQAHGFHGSKIRLQPDDLHGLKLLQFYTTSMSYKVATSAVSATAPA